MLEGRSFSGHERNCAYLNCGSSPEAQGQFANVSAVSGIDFPDDGRALVTTDWDQDGDLDIWIANRNAPRIRFLQNQLTDPKRFVSFQLVGNGTTVNRDAIGARVEVEFESEHENQEKTETVTRRQSVRAGEGFLSQSSKRIHFGAGPLERPARVIVHWPDGERQEWGPLEIGWHYRVTQGERNIRGVLPRHPSPALIPSPQQVPTPGQQAILRPLIPLTFPPLSYAGFRGDKQQVHTDGNRALLINLWASWCQPCLKELVAFAKQDKVLRDAGLDVIALNVDGLGEDETPPEAAIAFADRLQLPFTLGRADAPLLDQLQQLHDMHTTLRPPLPLPTSFLIGPTGDLIAIYKGPVTVETILADLKEANPSDREERFRRAAGLPGRMLRYDGLAKALEASEVERRFQYADWLQTHGFLREATDQYGSILRIDPDSAKAQIDLGSALLATGDLEGAEAALKKAIEIEPKSSRAHLRLGSLYLKRGQRELALEHLQKAEKLSPEDVSIINNLGTLYDQMGQYQRAIEQFDRAIALMPGEAGSYNNLAWLRATCPDGALRDAAQAVQLARKACQLTGWNDFSTLDTLATAYAAQGDWSEAVKWQQKAIEFAPPPQQTDLKRRLEAFKQKSFAPQFPPSE